jgi:hypothetical protein
MSILAGADKVTLLPLIVLIKITFVMKKVISSCLSVVWGVECCVETLQTSCRERLVQSKYHPDGKESETAKYEGKWKRDLNHIQGTNRKNNAGGRK